MDIFKELNVVLLSKEKEFKLTERINSQTKFHYFSNAYFSMFFDLIAKDKIKSENKDEEAFFNLYKNLLKNKNNEVVTTVNDYRECFTLYIHNNHRHQATLEIPKPKFLKILKDNIKELGFIDAIRISENETKLTLYNLILADDSFDIQKIETKSIIAEKGKGLNLGEDLDSFVKFLEKDNIGFFKEYGLTLIKNMIFDNFSYEKAFNEIYKDIRDILKGAFSFEDTYDVFKILYYYSFNDYYYYMEAMIKLDQKEIIPKMNPVFTNGPIPKVSDIKTLSNLNAKIMKNSRMFRKTDIELAIELEDESNFGVNGLNIFLETITLLNNLGLSSYFEEMAKDTLIILKTFKISIKNLMERMIREVFYNSLKGDEYLRYIVDYIEMCKMLKIELDEKLPKDVIRRHDMLVLQMKEVAKNGSSSMEKAFKNANDKNIELLKYAPKGTNFKIYCPESISDLVEKGFKANHCVGSYSGRIVDGSSKIFFVEEEGINGAYFTTFELNRNNELIQAKGFSNTVPRADVMKFIKSFIENIKKEEI